MYGLQFTEFDPSQAMITRMVERQNTLIVNQMETGRTINFTVQVSTHCSNKPRK